tara:strand:+ start:563 stop:850 length:288 start_codon:yes stop_codon:yes gene_type:complete
MVQTPNKRRKANYRANQDNKEISGVMDFEPITFKKGDMVRFYRSAGATLGIVTGQDANIVKVEWILWPTFTDLRVFDRPSGWYPLYKVQRVGKAG